MYLYCLSNEEISALNIQGKDVSYAISSQDRLPNRSMDIGERPGTVMGNTNSNYIHLDEKEGILYINPKYFHGRSDGPSFFSVMTEGKIWSIIRYMNVHIPKLLW